METYDHEKIIYQGFQIRKPYFIHKLQDGNCIVTANISLKQYKYTKRYIDSLNNVNLPHLQELFMQNYQKICLVVSNYTYELPCKEVRKLII